VHLAYRLAAVGTHPDNDGLEDRVTAGREEETVSVSHMIAASLMATLCAWQPARAQMSAPPIPSALPNISSISAANAAGILRYCVSKQLVSSTSADLVLKSLTAKRNVANSPDYSAGQQGRILATDGKVFSIPAAPSYLQSQACDQVLTRARQFPD